MSSTRVSLVEQNLEHPWRFHIFNQLPLKISPPMLVTKLFSGGGIAMGPENWRIPGFFEQQREIKLGSKKVIFRTNSIFINIPKKQNLLTKY